MAALYSRLAATLYTTCWDTIRNRNHAVMLEEIGIEWIDFRVVDVSVDDGFAQVPASSTGAKSLPVVDFAASAAACFATFSIVAR